MDKSQLVDLLIEGIDNYLNYEFSESYPDEAGTDDWEDAVITALKTLAGDHEAARQGQVDDHPTVQANLKSWDDLHKKVQELPDCYPASGNPSDPDCDEFEE